MGGIEWGHVIPICVGSYLFVWGQGGGGDWNGLSRMLSLSYKTFNILCASQRFPSVTVLSGLWPVHRWWRYLRCTYRKQSEMAVSFDDEQAASCQVLAAVKLQDSGTKKIVVKSSKNIFYCIYLFIFASFNWIKLFIQKCPITKKQTVLRFKIYSCVILRFICFCLHVLLVYVGLTVCPKDQRWSAQEELFPDLKPFRSAAWLAYLQQLYKD